VKLPSGVFDGPEGKTTVAEKRTGSLRKNKGPPEKNRSLQRRRSSLRRIRIPSRKEKFFVVIRIPAGKISFLEEKEEEVMMTKIGQVKTVRA